ncbi:hypothetical protein ACFL6G_01825 [candidate division KSB1 bacterium]
MKLFRLIRKQEIPLPINESWAFFSDPRNLSKITPDNLGFEIIYDSSDVLENMYPGMIIEYKVRPLLGIPVRWVTEITQVNEPYSFIDVQRLGPYKFWHHQHIFREVENGTEIIDIVHYALPFGYMGRLMRAFIVKRQLEKIFNYRTEYLKNTFGTLTSQIVNK